MKADSSTYGAVLLGSLFASGLSGIVTVQSVIYLKLFPSDRKLLKGLVVFVWILALTHIALVWQAIWEYFLVKFGDPSFIDYIPKGIALSVILTATMTLVAHCLFAHRIYYLSNKNLYLTMPIITLAFGRLAAAIVSGSEMIYLQSYTLFRQKFLWLFTLGLSLSCTVDILITFSLFFLLKMNGKKLVALNHIVDSIVLYAFEINLLTSAATVVAMLCWVILDNSLIFLGLHFVIGQLYANSLLATLNSRHGLRRAHMSSIDFLNFSLRQQNDTDVEFNHQEPVCVMLKETQV